MSNLAGEMHRVSGLADKSSANIGILDKQLKISESRVEGKTRAKKSKRKTIRHERAMDRRREKAGNGKRKANCK